MLSLHVAVGNDMIGYHFLFPPMALIVLEAMTTILATHAGSFAVMKWHNHISVVRLVWVPLCEELTASCHSCAMCVCYVNHIVLVIHMCPSPVGTHLVLCSI